MDSGRSHRNRDPPLRMSRAQKNQGTTGGNPYVDPLVARNRLWFLGTVSSLFFHKSIPDGNRENPRGFLSLEALSPNDATYHRLFEGHHQSSDSDQPDVISHHNPSPIRRPPIRRPPIVLPPIKLAARRSSRPTDRWRESFVSATASEFGADSRSGTLSEEFGFTESTLPFLRPESRSFQLPAAAPISAKRGTDTQPRHNFPTASERGRRQTCPIE